MKRLAVLLLPFALAVLTGCQDRDLPTGSAPPDPEFLIVSSPIPFTQVSAGLFHNCALRSDGALECWGKDDNGQAPTSRAAANGGNFTQVTGGDYHTCALRSNDTVECWGAGVVQSEDWPHYGQAAPPAGAFTQVSAGGYHTCAVRSDGLVECWGGNGYGQAPPNRAAANGGRFTQVSADWQYTCALRSDGAVECWGIPWATANRSASEPGETFTQVSAGEEHTCALRSDGVVECWGDNYFGAAPPIRPATDGGTFTQVSAGISHTCAVRSDGVVECWGWDYYGAAPPSRAATHDGRFTRVEGGRDHTCALRSDGLVECWGSNSSGQAPVSRSGGPYTTRILPTATFSTTPASVVVGQSFTLALTDAEVPGYTGAVSFTYAFDCGNGSGFGAFGASNTASCPTSATGTRTVRGIVRDHHDDQTEYTATVEVSLPPPPDVTPPVITPTISGTLGNNGWYTSDVTVSWTVVDPESAITSQLGCGTANIRSDTPGVTTFCQAESAGGSSVRTVLIKRDATPPVVNVTGVSAGATYTLGAVPEAGCSTTDALSGVATNATANVSGTVGVVTATCSGAADNAGNTAAPVSVTYAVIAPVLTVGANGTLNNRTGAATISGTANCSAATSLTVSVTLSQSQTKGKTTTPVSGSGSTTISCSGTMAWTVTVTPTSGKFAAGAASATASAPGASTVTQTVQLR